MSLHVIQTIGSIAEHSGGPARTVTALSEALARAGARVTMVAGHDHDRDGTLLRPDPDLVDLILVPVRRGFGQAGIPFAAAIHRLAHRDNATIVHDNGIWGATNAATSHRCRVEHLPLVVSPRGMLEPWALNYHATRKQLAWLLYQRRYLGRCAGMLATAPQERDSIRASVGDKAIAVIPNGVSCAPLWPSAGRPKRGDRRTMLFLSRLHPKKNLLGLVEAWAMARAREPTRNWQLQIHGPDSDGHRAEVAARIEALGLSADIVLGDAVAERDKAAVIGAADIVVLPSFSENFGLVVAEALASGVPVIACRGTPWSELPMRRCGWYVEPTPMALADALADAMQRPRAELLAMGKRGRAFAAQSFSWNRVGEQTLGFYEWIMRGGKVPEFVDV